MTEKNMLIIIDQYEGKMDFSIIQGQALKDEQAKVLALRPEKKVREEVIELFHKEDMKWMDRFTLTLN